ncbi:MAG: hypothetical protein ACO3JL_06140, partial [Myxococcota bacterium]
GVSRDDASTPGNDAGAGAGGMVVTTSAPLPEYELGQIDVAALLRVIAETPPSAPDLPPIDAGFFHRTLMRWMGLAPNDDSPAGRAPLWDYRFWKAELLAEGSEEGHAAILSADAQPLQVRTWSAIVYRGARSDPERYRYWVAFDSLGRVGGSGWLSSPPDLLVDCGEESAFEECGDEPVAELDLHALLAEDDA